MNSIRSRVGVAVLNRLLYAIGGFNGRERLRTVEVYDPESNKWIEVSEMLYTIGDIYLSFSRFSARRRTLRSRAIHPHAVPVTQGGAYVEPFTQSFLIIRPHKSVAKQC